MSHADLKQQVYMWNGELITDENEIEFIEALENFKHYILMLRDPDGSPHHPGDFLYALGLASAPPIGKNSIDYPAKFPIVTPPIAPDDEVIIFDKSAGVLGRIEVSNLPSGGGGGAIADMTGATPTAPGTRGLVPAPPAGNPYRFLNAAGQWVAPNLVNLPGVMTGASATVAGVEGLVPAPPVGSAYRFLNADGTWKVPSHIESPDGKAVFEFAGIPGEVPNFLVTINDPSLPNDSLQSVVINPTFGRLTTSGYKDPSTGIETYAGSTITLNGALLSGGGRPRVIPGSIDIQAGADYNGTGRNGYINLLADILILRNSDSSQYKVANGDLKNSNKLTINQYGVISTTPTYDLWRVVTYQTEPNPFSSPTYYNVWYNTLGVIVNIINRDDLFDKKTDLTGLVKYENSIIGESNQLPDAYTVNESFWIKTDGATPPNPISLHVKAAGMWKKVANL